MAQSISTLVNNIQDFSETYMCDNNSPLPNLVSHIQEFTKNINAIEIAEPAKSCIQQDLHYALGYSFKRFSRNLLREKENFTKAYQLQSETNHLSNTKLAVMLNNLASICVDLAHIDESILYAQKSLDLCKKLPEKKPLASDDLKIIGYSYLLKNDFDKAKFYFSEAISMISRLDEDLRKETESSIYALLGWLHSVTYINGDRAEAAKTYIHKSVAILNADSMFYTQSIKPIEKKEKICCEIVRAKINLGDVYCRSGDYKRAFELGFRDAKFIIDNHLDTCSHTLAKIYMAIGMGEIHLRENRLGDAKSTFEKVIKEAENLTGSDNMVTLSPRVFSAEVYIRLGELDLGYKSCLSALNVNYKENKSTNYSKLIHATIYYHAALIKQKQGDLKESFRYFKEFFHHIKPVSKLILAEKNYKMLEENRTFEYLLYEESKTLDGIKTCFKNSSQIFSTIYGIDHPFVRDYVLINNTLKD
jgi:tetratricopeptide (TPR) repeat protein